jgi:hypothetical protein
MVHFLENRGRSPKNQVPTNSLANITSYREYFDKRKILNFPRKQLNKNTNTEVTESLYNHSSILISSIFYKSNLKTVCHPNGQEKFSAIYDTFQMMRKHLIFYDYFQEHASPIRE